jgi:hypothetical protein
MNTLREHTLGDFFWVKKPCQKAGRDITLTLKRVKIEIMSCDIRDRSFCHSHLHNFGDHNGRSLSHRNHSELCSNLPSIGYSCRSNTHHDRSLNHGRSLYSYLSDSMKSIHYHHDYRSRFHHNCCNHTHRSDYRGRSCCYSRDHDCCSDLMKLIRLLLVLKRLQARAYQLIVLMTLICLTVLQSAYKWTRRFIK